jgi:hypothetical protein
VELAKEEVSALSQRAGCRKNISGVPAGRSVFLLTSHFIGLTENFSYRSTIWQTEKNRGSGWAKIRAGKK